MHAHMKCLGVANGVYEWSAVMLAVKMGVGSS